MVCGEGMDRSTALCALGCKYNKTKVKLQTGNKIQNQSAVHNRLYNMAFDSVKSARARQFSRRTVWEGALRCGEMVFSPTKI